MDARLKELERRVEREPTDVEAARALLMGLARVGDAPSAGRWAARILAAGAPGLDLVDALQALDAPLRALPFEGRHALVGGIDDQALVVAPLPFGQGSRAEVHGDLVLGVSQSPATRAAFFARFSAETDLRERESLRRESPNFSPHGDQVEVLRLADGLPAVEGSPFSLPEGLAAIAVTVVGSALFVAGKHPLEGDEKGMPRGFLEPFTGLVARRDLRRPHDPWDVLHLPVEACGRGKAVDALLLHGDRLVAVDDVVEPKWFFAFDVADPFAARLVDSRELPTHTTYESVRCAVLGPAGIAIVSQGYNHGTIGQFATLYDPASLVERCCVSTRHDHRARDPHELWHDVAVTRDLLVVATLKRGLVGLDLRTPPPAEVDGSRLRPVGKLKLARGEFVRRLAMVGPDRAIAAIAGEGRLVQRYATVTLALR